ncbi:adenosylcobinamide-GDP ribazoletransferase [Negativicoccus succinicivorans]
MQWVNVHFVRKLGGVTGDTYGAVTETSEIVILLIWLLQERIGVWNLL